MNGKKVVRFVELELAKQGLSKGEFYKKSGISSATFSQWRTGQYDPSKDALLKVEKALGISFDLVTVNSEINGEKEKPATKKSDGIEETDMSFIDDIKKLSPAQIEILRAAVQGFLQNRVSQDVQE